MSETLYRKYRPQKFSDVIGQEHIVTTLTNAIGKNRTGHAYLFTGPRGTGKTTTARLFAQALNCEKRKDFTPAPKNICENYLTGTALDLIEIDAASHTGVENIRELRETIGLTPTEAPFKVYIIDEVHMLSTGAFNALLKTLEEPPAHAIFILATTDIHKVPETIISRCQRFDFTRFSVADIVSKITAIATSESVTLEPAAAELIALTANGGMRDAESLLAQVFALEDKNVTEEEVSRILGATTSQDVLTVIEHFVAKDAMSAITTINTIADKGYNLDAFAKALITKLRALMFFAIAQGAHDNPYLTLTQTEKTTIAELAKKTTTQDVAHMITECETAKSLIASSTIPQLPLEIATVHICGTTPKNTTPSEKTPQPQDEESSPAKTTQEAKTPVKKMTKIVNPQLSQITEIWQECVAKIKEINTPLGGLLATSEPSHLEDNTLTIDVRYSLHKDKIMEPQNLTLLTETLHAHTDKKFTIITEIISDDVKKKKATEVLSYASDLMNNTSTESPA